MLGMCAIFGHSSPFSLSHRCFRRGHPSIIREERVVGKRSSGKYWRLSQLEIYNFLREVRCWKPLSDFSFGKDEISKSVRVVGSNASSGKDSTSWGSVDLAIPGKIVCRSKRREVLLNIRANLPQEMIPVLDTDGLLKTQGMGIGCAYFQAMTLTCCNCQSQSMSN